MREQDRPLLQDWREHPSSPFDDFGGDLPDRQPALPEGTGQLSVVDGADALLGSVGWHPVGYGPGLRSVALNIGIVLQPAARGKGHGTRAQQLLADYLFATTDVHRLEASTDLANIAEQRALGRARFAREGVLRGAQWRAGDYRDLVGYSRLRTDRLPA